MHLLQIVWDPSSKGINIIGDFTIHYYSMMWMIAFILGWYITKRIYKNEGQSNEKMESLFIYSVLGIMIGARLGHVIFYQPELIREDFSAYSFRSNLRVALPSRGLEALQVTVLP